jgi:hypothetical protein
MLHLETDSDSYEQTRLDYHLTVRELPSHERPRERLQRFGSQALSTAELLAIVLRTGIRGDNALELANKLLSKYGGLPGSCAPISASCAPSTAWEWRSRPRSRRPGGRAQAGPRAGRYSLQDQHPCRCGQPGH